jgi:hypothetical protein
MAEEKKEPGYVGIFFATLLGTALSSLAIYYATRPRKDSDSYADRIARSVIDSLSARFGKPVYDQNRKDI